MLEHMFPLGEVRDELAAWVAALDAPALTPAAALGELTVAIEIEKLAAAAKTLLFSRAADSGEWTRRGYRSAEHWLAALSGESLTDATRTAETAERLRDLPHTEAAVRGGELSSAQANEITAAAHKAPAAEPRLLEKA